MPTKHRSRPNIPLTLLVSACAPPSTHLLLSIPPQGLRASIPAHFPYFYVEWGLREGYVHVIDDTQKWSPNFGRDVLIGLLELPAEWTRGKQRRDSRPEAERLMKEFLKSWDPVDWTKQLQ